MSDREPAVRTTSNERVSDTCAVSVLAGWRFSRKYIVGTVATTIVTEIAVYGLIVAVLPDLLSQLGAHGQQQARLTSYMLAIYTGTSALFSPLAGVLTDLTTTRKWPLITGLLAYSGATIAFFAAPNVAVALLAKFLQGFSSALMIAAAYTLCMDTVALTELGATFGLLLSIADAGALLSPTFGGIIYVYGGRLWLVVTSLALLSIALFMNALVGESTLRRQPAPGTPPDSSKSPLLDNEESQSLLGTMAYPGEASFQGDRYVLKPSQNAWIRKAPIIQCLTDYRFVGAIALCFVQTSLSGAFEAILALEGGALFGFSPDKAGYLFIPLGVPRYAFGVIGGWAVSRYGPRRLGLLFYLLLVPVLLMFYLLRPTPRTPQIALMSCLLALSGMCMAAVGTVSFVEGSNIMDKYHRSNPHIFGDRGPFAALFGIILMVWALGTSMGSLIAGDMRLIIGLGNTMAIFAGFSLLGVLGSYFCLDRTPPMTTAKPSTRL